MTITVTAGSASANAYVSLADFKTYCDDRGLTYPTTSGGDATIEAAIIRGAQYMDGRYRRRWKGYKAAQAQAMAWPRSGVKDEDGYTVDSSTLPAVIVNANCEAAQRIAAGTDLVPDLARGGAVKMERVKAGPVESETEYADGAAARTAVTAIDDMLSGVLVPSGWVERA